MTNGEEILKEMNAFSMNAVQAAPGQRSGEEVLPFESLDDYSTDPIGFEELADMVNNKVKYFFSLSAKYNHRAPEYLEVCGFLERGIKYLGSCCLTKVMLKKKGHELPKLDELSTHWLYGMVSFNIRKLNRTVDEELSHSGTIPSKWLDMQFRYINLAERLRSTETKIYEYTSYYWLDSDKFVRRALMFSENAYNRVDVKNHVRKPDFRLAPSFPAIKIENKKSEIRNQDSEYGAQEVSDGGEAPAPNIDRAKPAHHGAGPVFPVREDTTRCRKELSTETPEDSTQSSVPGTRQSAAGDNGDCRPKNKKSEIRNQNSEYGAQELFPETPCENAEKNKKLEIRNKKSESGNTSTQYAVPGTQQRADDTRQDPGTEIGDHESGGDEVIPNSELRIPHSDEPVPAFMAILERAAERSKDKEDGGICFTFEELDALAFDPEFREFDPDLAEVIRKRHAELFPGIGSP